MRLKAAAGVGTVEAGLEPAGIALEPAQHAPDRLLATFRARAHRHVAVDALPDAFAVERGEEVPGIGEADIGLGPRRAVHLRDRRLGNAVRAVAALGEPHDIEGRIIGEFEQRGQTAQVIAREMSRPLEALVVEGDPVPRKLGCHQRLERGLLFAGDRGGRGTNGDIRHEAQPMALVRGRASQ